MSNHDPAASLAEQWREQAAAHQRDGALVEGAALLRRCADELEARVAAYGAELLDLQDAAAESGYSADHLGRLVRDGTLPNAGRPHAPRIKRADLPRKPCIASSALSSLPFRQMVRSVASSHNGGSDG